MSSLNKLSEAVVDTVARTAMMRGVLTMTAVMMGVLAMTAGVAIKNGTIITSITIRYATNTTEFD